MNANEMNPQTNTYLNRIRKTSRALKVMLLVYLGGLVVFLPVLHQFHKTADGYWTVFNVTYATLRQIPWIVKMLALLCVGLLVTAFTTGYQLLSLYERGIIFSTKNVRLLRWIGFLIVSYGVLPVAVQTLLLVWEHWLGASSGNLLITFSFNFFGLLISPWIISGIFIMVISHIMGEACKMREEQELTV